MCVCSIGRSCLPAVEPKHSLTAICTAKRLKGKVIRSSDRAKVRANSVCACQHSGTLGISLPLVQVKAGKIGLEGKLTF